MACCREVIYFHRMFQMGNLEAMRQIYGECPNIVSFTDTDGWNALFFAVSTDQVEVVDWLLTLTSIDRNSRDKNGISIFEWAALRAHMPLCKILFSTSKDLIAPTQTKSLPESALLSSSHPPSSTSEKSRTTVLHYAAYSGNIDVFLWLRSHITTCSINTRDADGASPAHYSALRGHMALTRTLIDDDSIDAVSHRDNDGATLLHYAALGGHLDVCKMLCEQRVDLVKTRTSKGLDAAGYARLHGHSTVVDFIRNARKHILREGVSYSPTSFQIELGNPSIVKKL